MPASTTVNVILGMEKINYAATMEKINYAATLNF
jgi:hypothetical protein